jgi:thioredoxin 1
VGKLDIDDAPEVTKKYGVRSVPTIIVFRGGQKTGQLVGLTSREKIVQLLGI